MLHDSGSTWTLNLRKMIQVFDHCATTAIFHAKCYTLLSLVSVTLAWLEPSNSGKWYKCLTTVLPLLDTSQMLHLLSLVPVTVTWIEPSTSGKWYKCLTTVLPSLYLMQMLHLILPLCQDQRWTWILNLSKMIQVFDHCATAATLLHLKPKMLLILSLVSVAVACCESSTWKIRQCLTSVLS